MLAWLGQFMDQAKKGSSKKVGDLRSLFNFVQHYYFGQLNIMDQYQKLWSSDFLSIQLS